MDRLYCTVLTVLYCVCCTVGEKNKDSLLDAIINFACGIGGTRGALRCSFMRGITSLSGKMISHREKAARLERPVPDADCCVSTVL